MSAGDLVQGITQAIYLLIALVTIIEVVRRPRRANLDIALFFIDTAAIIIIAAAEATLRVQNAAAVSIFTGALLMALPYLLLRLVDDFIEMPAWVQPAAAFGLAFSIVALVVLSPRLPPWVAALLLLYFVVVEVYASVKFVDAARHSAGVTQRRMEAIAAGSLLLGLVILVAGLQLAVPRLAGVWLLASQTFALLSGVAYYLGFATPAVLRRAWQEPELRAFLASAAQLPHLPDIATIVQALERGVAMALGGADVTIGLYDETADRLRYRTSSGDELLVVPGEFVGGQSFNEQRALLSLDAPRDDPAHAEFYRRSGAQAVLAAPITSGSRQIGALTAYAARPPLFAEDDLALVQLLAYQASIILDYALLYEEANRRAEEIQALYQEAKRTEAQREQLIREQAARAEAEAAVRARDEFLSIAAHELKTPITSMRGFAQLLLRQADRGGSVSLERLQRGLAVIDQQSVKINRLVTQLLDLSRLDLGRLVLELRRTDLVALVQGVVTATQQITERHQFVVEAPAVADAMVDPLRLEQVFVNLMDNAIKYSPSGGAIEVRVAQPDPSVVEVSVRDHGIGIPEERRAHIFDRFFQAHAAGHLSGMGLGLHIARHIVDLHQGRITVEAPPDGGTRFIVAVPAAP